MKEGFDKFTISHPEINKINKSYKSIVPEGLPEGFDDSGQTYTVTFTANEINWDSEGTKNDDEKPIMGLLFPEFLEEMAWKLTEGYEKYGYKNYMKGLDELRIISAALRHLMHVMRGDEPPEGEHSHEAAVAVNMMMLYEKRVANDNNHTDKKTDQVADPESREKYQHWNVRSDAE